MSGFAYASPSGSLSRSHLSLVIGILACLGRVATAQPADAPLAVPYNLPAVHHGSVDIGDLDDDGKLDVAIVGMTSSRTILSIWQLGDSTFSPPDTDELFRTNVYRNADRDGDFDVFAVGAPQALAAGVLRLYTYNGSRFGPTWHRTGYRNAAIDVGDYNGDGDADVITSGEQSVGAPRLQFPLNRDYFECVSPSWVPLFQPFGNCT